MTSTTECAGGKLYKIMIGEPAWPGGRLHGKQMDVSSIRLGLSFVLKVAVHRHCLAALPLSK